MCVRSFQFSDLQIDYVMEYGWHTNLPRLEARNYINLFGHASSPWLKENNYEYAQTNFHHYVMIDIHLSFWIFINDCALVCL